MRMRKKKNAPQRLENCGALVFLSAQQLRQAGGWQAVFGNSRPIHLEIGCGKGAFAAETARRRPDVNLVALEKNIDVFVMAAEQIRDAGLSNVRLALGDAQALAEWFLPKEVSLIYLNFSDPWPKSGHAKRRLTHDRYLELYSRILTPKGHLHLKTDNADFFDFSLEAFSRCGLEVSEVTYDLHAGPGAPDNVMTEYESKFTDLGFPIHRCVVSFNGPIKSGDIL